jgi:serine phosphatase RsbU (regulator of sigma subunit)
MIPTLASSPTQLRRMEYRAFSEGGPMYCLMSALQWKKGETMGPKKEEGDREWRESEKQIKKKERQGMLATCRAHGHRRVRHTHTHTHTDYRSTKARSMAPVMFDVVRIIQRETDRERQREKERDRDRERETEREGYRERERDTEREGYRERERGIQRERLPIDES